MTLTNRAAPEQRDIANQFFEEISVSFNETKFATTYSIGTRLKVQVIKFILPPFL